MESTRYAQRHEAWNKRKIVGQKAPFKLKEIWDLSLLRFLEHRVERVRLGPAVYRRVDSVCNGSPRFDGSIGHVRIDAQV